MALINEIEALIPSAMKSGDTVRLNTLRDIKNNLFKAKVAISKDYELSKAEVDKIMLKMVSQMEESIVEFKKGNRNDLVEEYSAQLNIIKEFAPKVASDEEITSLTNNVISDYLKSKGEGYTLSMKDMRPIMIEVQKTIPTANGGIISKILKTKIA